VWFRKLAADLSPDLTGEEGSPRIYATWWCKPTSHWPTSHGPTSHGPISPQTASSPPFW